MIKAKGTENFVENEYIYIYISKKNKINQINKSNVSY